VNLTLPIATKHRALLGAGLAAAPPLRLSARVQASARWGPRFILEVKTACIVSGGRVFQGCDLKIPLEY
jgi:hypothetical protein